MGDGNRVGSRREYTKKILALGKTKRKNASYSELGLEAGIGAVASFEGSNSRGFNGPICADRSWASGQGRDPLNLFSTISNQYSFTLCPIGNVLFQPGICSSLRKAQKNKQKAQS